MATRVAMGRGDHEAALAAARSTYQVGVRHGVTELQAIGLVETHRIGIMISRGAWRSPSSWPTGPAPAPSASTSPTPASLLPASVISGCEWATSPAPRRPSSRPKNWGPARCPDGPGWSCCSAAPLAVNDLDTAEAATSELTESAQTYGSKALLAAAECARGGLALATGEGEPMRSLRRGVALWAEASSPYERARARMLLATALQRAGQLPAAQHERATAHACFTRLGARLDTHAAAEPVLARLAAGESAGG